MNQDVKFYDGSDLKKLFTNKLFIMAEEALAMASIRMPLPDNDVVIGKLALGEKKDYIILAMVVKYDNKYYCFNYYPERKSVTLTYTLEKCDDMKVKVLETLKSLERLYKVI